MERYLSLIRWISSYKVYSWKWRCDWMPRVTKLVAQLLPILEQFQCSSKGSVFCAQDIFCRKGKPWKYGELYGSRALTSFVFSLTGLIEVCRFEQTATNPHLSLCAVLKETRQLENVFEQARKNTPVLYFLLSFLEVFLTHSWEYAWYELSVCVIFTYTCVVALL